MINISKRHNKFGTPNVKSKQVASLNKFEHDH